MNDIKIEIGFEGGRSLMLTLPESSADDLQRGIGGDGAVTVEAEDGRYTLALSKIAYVRRLTREGRVGFVTG